MNISDLLATEITGNALGDRKLMDLISNFAEDPDNSWQDRSDALDHMQTEVMGCPISDEQKSWTPQQNVEDYLKERGSIS